MQNNTSHSITFLDCTLRDGGYYTDWDFNISQAQEYIENLANGGVDVIELGFRFTPKKNYLGPFAYTSEAFLSQLKLPSNVQFGVMINASDYLSKAWREDLEASFVKASVSSIGLVRIATHIGQVMDCANLVGWLKDSGYDVGLNIMQISQADEAQITNLIARLDTEFVNFEALYFADSLGNLSPEEVIRIVSLFRANSAKSIGFHGHDNIGLGVVNSLAALDAGATWIDATITGMGRGAGNTQTEYLTLEMSRRGLHDFSNLDIQRAATGWLMELKRKHEWGTNIFYYEAGLQSLHPSYAQQMITSKTLQPIDILTTIRSLSQLEAPTSYREANIDKALAKLLSQPEGKSDVSGQWAGRPVMLLAAGKNGERYWPQIKAYGEKVNAVCIAINYLDFITPKHLSGVVCIHPARMMELIGNKNWRDVPLYTPIEAFPENIKKQILARPCVVDYGVQVKDGVDFSTKKNGCVINNPEALPYVWAIAEQAEASEILLVGFDGYDGQSKSFHKTNELLAQLASKTKIQAVALTKTHYNLRNQSIF
jgi:4-hydroxy 2-oxovalerate aldolase